MCFVANVPDAVFVARWYHRSDVDDSGHLDAWTRRQVEQVLASELNIAGEAVRLANLHWHDLTGPHPSDAQRPDSNVEHRQALAACTRAQQAWQIAIDRWLDFVKNGTIPEELLPPDRPSGQDSNH